MRVSSDKTTFDNGGSFSGHERDKLFASARGSSFSDISGISGLDDEGDGRTSSILDLDQDGWPDIALASANAPLLQLFRNRGRSLQSAPNHFVALRFVGGNQAASPHADLSPRDGYGAWATLVLGDRTLLRPHLCGQGFAAQNSQVMLIGMGARESADLLTVSWPGGTRARLEDVKSGSMVTAYERGPEGQPEFVVTRYGPASSLEEPESAHPIEASFSEDE